MKDKYEVMKEIEGLSIEDISWIQQQSFDLWHKKCEERRVKDHKKLRKMIR